MVEMAALSCLEAKRPVIMRAYKNLRFDYDGTYLTLELPSGRKLFYREAQVYINRFNKRSIRYKGSDTLTKQWGWVDSYGGKFVENIVQAIARDVLAVSMARLDRAGYDIVLHVHDEVVVEVPSTDPGLELNYIEELMSNPITWAEGLPLGAEGYISNYYKKE
jgi:DNA polymerase